MRRSGPTGDAGLLRIQGRFRDGNLARCAPAKGWHRELRTSSPLWRLSLRLWAWHRRLRRLTAPAPLGGVPRPPRQRRRARMWTLPSPRPTFGRPHPDKTSTRSATPVCMAEAKTSRLTFPLSKVQELLTESAETGAEAAAEKAAAEEAAAEEAAAEKAAAEKQRDDLLGEKAELIEQRVQLRRELVETWPTCIPKLLAAHESSLEIAWNQPTEPGVAYVGLEVSSGDTRDFSALPLRFRAVVDSPTQTAWLDGLESEVSHTFRVIIHHEDGSTTQCAPSEPFRTLPQPTAGSLPTGTDHAATPAPSGTTETRSPEIKPAPAAHIDDIEDLVNSVDSAKPECTSTAGRCSRKSVRRPPPRTVRPAAPRTAGAGPHSDCACARVISECDAARSGGGKKSPPVSPVRGEPSGAPAADGSPCVEQILECAERFWAEGDLTASLSKYGEAAMLSR